MIIFNKLLFKKSNGREEIKMLKLELKNIYK